MKTKITLLILLFTVIGFAQNGINYKAVIKDDLGNVVANQSVSVRFTVLEVATNVYQETQSSMTDSNGIAILNIGEGTPVSGTFSNIDWGSDDHFLKVDIDITGGTSYIPMTTTQFKAVPYALNVSKKQHVIGIPASAFSPNNNDCSFVNSIGNGGVEITSTNGAVVTSLLNAPIQFPHGARIDSMTVYYTDNSDAQLNIWLAKEFYTPGFNVVAEVITNGNSSTSVEETVTVNQVVDNENAGYYIRIYCDNWDESGSKKVKGVKIYYTY